MRIQQRVFVIESGDVAKIQNPILHAVDPTAAVRLRVGRKTERMRDASGRVTIVGQLPKLFHADAVNLRLAAFVKTKSLDQLLRQ